MKYKSLGAVREVTGSMHLLISEQGSKLLLDCGMFQGKRSEAEQKNRNPKINPKDVDAIIISHAHLDHCGLAPLLVKKGFTGPIYVTPATAELMQYILADSAYLQQKDAEYINKKRKKGEPKVEVLYSQQDVETTLGLLNIKNFNSEFEISGGFNATFYRAGHILGSALVEVKESGKTLLFTGDLGRKNAPLLQDPEDLSNHKINYLITESTYGGRIHHDFTQGRQRISQAINKIDQTKGKLIIPAFSLGRTQEIVYSIHQLRVDKKIPQNIEVFVDSPLSVNVTEIFRQHFYELDEETQELMRKDGDPLGFGTLKYTKSVEESKALNTKEGPFVVISASGMCEGGRIVHHLKNSISDSKNIILIVSFQAQHTLGRRIAEGNNEIKIFGEKYRVAAEVLTNNEWSAHADSNELVKFATSVNPDQTFLVHGEMEQMEMLKNRLQDNDLSVTIPDLEDSIRQL
ncbi:MAG: MBL fold metallo-hydrolase [bacterium]